MSLSLSCVYGSQSEDDISYLSDFNNEFELEAQIQAFRAIGAYLSFDAGSDEELLNSPQPFCDLQGVVSEHELQISGTMDHILGKVDVQSKRLDVINNKLQQLKTTTDHKQLQKSNLDKKNK